MVLSANVTVTVVPASAVPDTVIVPSRLGSVNRLGESSFSMITSAGMPNETLELLTAIKDTLKT